jgi:hypothetical protein
MGGCQRANQRSLVELKHGASARLLRWSLHLLILLLLFAFLCIYSHSHPTRTRKHTCSKSIAVSLWSWLGVSPPFFFTVLAPDF